MWLILHIHWCRKNMLKIPETCCCGDLSGKFKGGYFNMWAMWAIMNSVTNCILIKCKLHLIKYIKCVNLTSLWLFFAQSFTFLKTKLSLAPLSIQQSLSEPASHLPLRMNKEHSLTSTHSAPVDTYSDYNHNNWLFQLQLTIIYPTFNASNTICLYNISLFIISSALTIM